MIRTHCNAIHVCQVGLVVVPVEGATSESTGGTDRVEVRAVRAELLELKVHVVDGGDDVGEVGDLAHAEEESGPLEGL